MKVAVIQGPNLNMLGIREQHIYGPMSLEQIHEQMKGSASQNDIELEIEDVNQKKEPKTPPKATPAKEIPKKTKSKKPTTEKKTQNKSFRRR